MPYQEHVFKNYLAVCTVRVDTTRKNQSDEKGYYSSFLSLYQIGQEQDTLRFFMRLNDPNKRSITCASTFMGHLVVSKSFENLPNLYIILARFNEQKMALDNAKPQANVTIKNIASCISYDQDLIILGDSLKNLSVLKNASAEENQKELLKADDLNLKKYLKNDLDASVVNAFSMARHLSSDKTDYHNRIDSQGQPFGTVNIMSEQAKRMLSILSVQTDGYVRLYRLKETKQLDVCA